MGEFRLNAVRTDTDEVIDYIDLREPIDSSKIVRNRNALKERVVIKLGGSVAGLVEVRVDSSSHLARVDLPSFEQESASTLSPAELSIVVNE